MSRANWRADTQPIDMWPRSILLRYGRLLFLRSTGGGGRGGGTNTPVTPPITDPITLPGPITLPVTELDVRPVTSGPETSFDIARIQRAADILVLPSDLLPEPECDPDSADTSCDVSVQSR